MNDGINNEYQIVEAYDNKKINELTDEQRKIIHYISPVKDNEIIHASKIKGIYKPDVKFVIAEKDYNISVKKGSGNSVHQEKAETFIDFCEEYLDMPEDVKNSLLYFLYGDGTIDGSGDFCNRLGDSEVKVKYAKEIKKVDDFLNKHKEDLIERFFITGRFGRDTGIIADYLYHGTYDKGVICSLNRYAIEYIASMKKGEGDGIYIGPLTLQAWNRNLKNNPKNENRRDSIQIKCGNKFIELICGINNYLSQLSPEQIHLIEKGDNSHGIKNQEYIASALNDHTYKSLNSNLRNFIRTLFPNVQNSDVIHAKKITDNRIKPKLSIEINQQYKYCSVKIGNGNSVHQEKLSEFIKFLKKLNISDELLDIFLMFIYGDGTNDGTGDVSARLNEAQIIMVLGNKFDKLKYFFNEHRVELAKRFLMYGAREDISSDAIYYGTEQYGIAVPYDKVISFIESTTYESGKLHIGPLTIQTWNRNLNGEKEKDYKRESIQVKWSNIDSDLNEIKLLSKENQDDGVRAEYELVSLLNRNKTVKLSIWSELSNNLNLNALKNIYAVRVTKRVESSLSNKMVFPKSDLYLIKANYDMDFLRKCNFNLDEDVIENTEYEYISGSGISCKKPSSTSFTYQKFTIDSFNSLFNNPYIGAGISLFISEKDLEYNEKILQKWGIDACKFKDYFIQAMNISIPNDFLSNGSICSKIKKWSSIYLSSIIENDTKIQDVIFKGKHIFRDPYYSEFIYHEGIFERIFMPKYTITNGSGRHKGNITIIIKPK